MKRRYLAATAALALAAVVTGCTVSTDQPGTDDRAGKFNPDLLERKIHLLDGRDVTCVIYNGYGKGGVSCDWVGAK